MNMHSIAGVSIGCLLSASFIMLSEEKHIGHGFMCLGLTVYVLWDWLYRLQGE